MSTQIDLIPLRESRDVIPYLTKAFAAYCKYSRKEALSEDDKNVLKFCYDNSLQPMLPSFFKLKIPFCGFSHYGRFPFDLMHTFIGVLKKYVALTLLCIRKVSGLANYKNRGGRYTISKLDALIKSFPYNMHCMPYYLKHFTDGISPYCQKWLGEDGDKKGYGDLKIIDYKDVPSLILQMILCKYYLEQKQIF